VPYLIDFRTPWYAFSFYQQFLYSVLISLGLFSIITRVKRFIPLFIIIFLLIDLIIPFPIVSGNMENRVYFPEYFLNTVNYLNSQEGNFNVLLLPESPTWFSSSWYVGNNVFIYFSKHQVFFGGLYDSQNSWLRNAYSLICTTIYEGNVSRYMLIYNLFYLLNVKYIVFQGDFKSSPLVHFDINSSEMLRGLNEFQEEGILTLVRNFSPYYVYRVNINSSNILVGNSLPNSSIQWLSENNVSEYLHPFYSYKFVNPVEIKIWNLHDKYLFFVYSYDKIWRLNNEVPSKLFYGNLYEVNGSSMIVSSIQGKNFLRLIFITAYSIFLILYYPFLYYTLRKHLKIY